MLSCLRYTLLSLVRNKIMILWTLAFPILLSTIFIGLFSGLDRYLETVRMDLGVVEDAGFRDARGLEDLLDQVSSPDADVRLATIAHYASEGEARAAANAGTIQGYLTVDDDGTPVLHVAAGEDGEMRPTAMLIALDSYLQLRTEVEVVAAQRPEALADGSAVAAITGETVSSTRLAATKSPPNPSVRFYLSLLGMTAGMGMMLAVLAVKRIQPMASPLGARRSLAGIPRWRLLLGCVLGAWLIELACLALTCAYMRVVAGVDLGGNLPGVALALLVASLMSCSLGSLLGSLRMVDTGMVSGISCLLSLFTGLYGPGAQELADSLEASLPALAHANPLWQIAHTLFSLLYYDTPAPFAQGCLTMLAMAVAFLALAALASRRISHVHL